MNEVQWGLEGTTDMCLLLFLLPASFYIRHLTMLTSTASLSSALHWQSQIIIIITEFLLCHMVVAQWLSGLDAELAINRSQVRILASPLSNATLGKLLTHTYAKQYNLVAAGKVTIRLASHWPRITDISGSPLTGSRPRRGRWAPAYALLCSIIIIEEGDEHPPTLSCAALLSLLLL